MVEAPEDRAKDRQDKIRADTTEAAKRLRGAVQDAGGPCAARVKSSVKKAERAAKRLATRANDAPAKAAAKDAA